MIRCQDYGGSGVIESATGRRLWVIGGRVIVGVAVAVVVAVAVAVAVAVVVTCT